MLLLWYLGIDRPPLGLASSFWDGRDWPKLWATSKPRIMSPESTNFFPFLCWVFEVSIGRKKMKVWKLHLNDIDYHWYHIPVQAFFLTRKLHKSKSCVGVSCRMQVGIGGSATHRATHWWLLSCHEYDISLTVNIGYIYIYYHILYIYTCVQLRMLYILHLFQLDRNDGPFSISTSRTSWLIHGSCQEMYALVFIFRYLDLLWSYISASRLKKIEVKHGNLWVFPKIMVPPNHPFGHRVFHYKPSILGYPYFWKHPFMFTLLTSLYCWFLCIQDYMLFLIYCLWSFQRDFLTLYPISSPMQHMY